MIKRGPFGFEMGMRPNELPNEFREIGPGVYHAPTAPKPHSAFSNYVLSFSDRYGLHSISAYSSTIHTSTYGSEITAKFNELKAKLEKVYGNCESYDFLMYGSIWDEPRDWMHSLMNKDRSLAAAWDEKYGSRLDNQIATIFLNVTAESTTEGHISLAYFFENNGAVVAEREQLEDEAL